jgi:3-hydroxyisobutyrate dehydrogenase
MPGGITDVGFIGVGTMGFPMASNLLAAGFSLVVHDRDPAPVAKLVELGAGSGASPREVGERCRHVVTMLPNSPHVEAVLTGPDGLLAGLAPGGTIIDMSTIDPGTTRALAAQARDRGLRLIDAPVSGSTVKARDGTLTIMVGGDAAVLEECRPILDVLGENIVHVGPVGTGETVKLVNNLIAAISMAAVAEGFNIGVRHGLDPRVLYEVVSKSSGDCWSLRTRVPYPDVVTASPANEGFAPGFMADLMHKDVGLALAAAKAVDAPALLGAVAEQLYRAARARGHGREDFSAVAKVVQDLSGPAPREADG